MTGQTGSGQARLTLGGSNRRCPRDWNGDPAERFASGSAHQATVPVQQGRLQRSSLFLVHALQRRLLLHQLRIRTEAFDDEYKYVLTELGSPFKGLGFFGMNLEQEFVDFTRRKRYLESLLDMRFEAHALSGKLSVLIVVGASAFRCSTN